MMQQRRSGQFRASPTCALDLTAPLINRPSAKNENRLAIVAPSVKYPRTRILEFFRAGRPHGMAGLRQLARVVPRRSRHSHWPRPAATAFARERRRNQPRD